VGPSLTPYINQFVSPQNHQEKKRGKKNPLKDTCLPIQPVGKKGKGVPKKDGKPDNSEKVTRWPPLVSEQANCTVNLWQWGERVHCPGEGGTIPPKEKKGPKRPGNYMFTGKNTFCQGEGRPTGQEGEKRSRKRKRGQAKKGTGPNNLLQNAKP